jgi:hypothetical protein
MRSILFATVALSVIATGALADETLKFRSVYHVTAAQAQDIGDIDGHTMSLVRSSRLASFRDGSVAADNVVAGTDYIKGSGPFLAYGTLTLNDGSALWYKTNAMAAVQGTKTNLSGTITIVGGKGRFEGAKGDGSMAGARLQTLAAGAEIYVDVTLNIKK